MPERIQRRRSKGWTMPEGAIYVGRGSRWGNPWSLATAGKRPDGTPWDIGDLARWYRRYIVAMLGIDPTWLDPLRGHDLACWCALDVEWCHADELLRRGNAS